MNLTLYTVDLPFSQYHGWYGVGLGNGKSRIFKTEELRTLFILKYQGKNNMG